MKKIISIVLCALMLTGIFSTFTFADTPSLSGEERLADASKWDGTIPTAPDTLESLKGDGTESNPYLLESAADLALVAAYINAAKDDLYGEFLKLNCDIDIQNQAWPGIGVFDNRSNDKMAFKGNFDGQGHVVFNLNLLSRDSSSTKQSAGFFGFFGFGGTIKNLGIASGNIYVKNTTYTGALVGVVENLGIGRIENCFNLANITTTCENLPDTSYASGASLRTVCAGGIVGYVYKRANPVNTTIKNCFNDGNITAVKQSADQAVTLGGIVAENGASNLTLMTCCNYGDMGISALGKNGDQYGLLIGTLTGKSSITADSCYMSGAITTNYYDEQDDANNRAGALVGGLWSSTSVKACSNNTYNGSFTANGTVRTFGLYGTNQASGDTSKLSTGFEATSEIKTAPDAYTFNELKISTENTDTSSPSDPAPGPDASAPNNGDNNESANNKQHNKNDQTIDTSDLTDAVTDEPDTEEKGGCGSVINFAIPFVLITGMCTVCTLKKNKED